MKWIIKNSIAFLLLGLTFLGCDLNKKAKVEENSTATGEITIVADEALMPIVDAQVKAFESIYKNAKINVVYGSEGNAINQLLNKKVNLVIASRALTEEENSEYKSVNKYSPKSLKVGIDALALIANKENPDSTISYEEIQGILTGKIKAWQQINKESSLKDINVIFDNDSTAAVRYLKDSVAKTNTLPPNCFAVNSNEKVINYVAENKNSLGIIGVSWISDSDDSATVGFLNKVKVLAVSKPGHAEYEDEYYQPYQAYIANGEYPFSRGIYIINAEPGVRLGSGFTAFVASDRGQRIILKSGLVPATMPIRVVKIGKNPLNF